MTKIFWRKYSKLLTILISPIIGFIILLTFGTSKANAGYIFELNESGISHMAWPFLDSSWYNKNGWWDAGWNDGHTYEDIYAQDWNWNSYDDDCGKNVYSPFSGKVIFAGDASNGYGNQIVIQSYKSPDFAFRVAHLQTISVFTGDSIEVKTKIGEVGKTGVEDYSCHAHSVLYKNINTELPGSSETLLNKLSIGKRFNKPAAQELYATDFSFDVTPYRFTDIKKTPMSGNFGLDRYTATDITAYSICGNDNHACWRTFIAENSWITAYDFGAGGWFTGNEIYKMPISGDFDGNAYDDITYYGKCGSDGHYCWRTHVSYRTVFSSKDFGTSASFKEGNEIFRMPVAGNFDGDNNGHNGTGYDDIAYYAKCGNDGHDCWRVLLSNGSKFTPYDFGDGAFFDGIEIFRAPVSGDFDGNGKDDIAYYGRCGNDNHECWRVHLSNGNGFTVQDFGSSGNFTTTNISGKPVAGNFNNDQYDDIAYYGKCGSDEHDCWRVHLSNGSEFTAYDFGSIGMFGGNEIYNIPMSGNFDNTGPDDVIYYGKCGSDGHKCWRAYISDGVSFQSYDFGDNARF